MHSLALRLDPQRLANPDLDIRYVLPDLLAERSGGVIQDDGYDYAGGRPPYLVLFLKATDLESATALIRDVIENKRILDNDLRAAVAVAIGRGDGYEVIYPGGFSGEFLPK